MPLYEYECERCGDVFEVRQKFSDEPLTAHEKCGGPVHRLLSPPALQFKGSGWYITDYAKAGSKGGGSSSGSSGNGGSSSGTSTESKPAAAESKPASSSSDSKKS
ncbi:MAG TPA: FmdB family zinc ribbon protein [Bryobacteraceae bacterium]|nr:FmdB family zinc ribbon protein [Bryobacteraceae bacterium]